MGLLQVIRCSPFLLTLSVITPEADSAAGLKLNVNCGNKLCKQDEYCSQHTYDCSPCYRICDRTSNNYDSHTCEQECQNYLHISRFLARESVSLTPTTSLSGPGNTSMIATVALIVSAVSLLGLVAVITFGLIYLKRHHLIFAKTRNKLANNKVTNNNGNSHENQTISYKVDNLKLHMPAAGDPVAVPPPPPPSVTATNEPVTPATTSTPLSTRPRHPVEDRTLEYAYDNPALTPSPVLDKDGQQQAIPSRIESSF